MKRITLALLISVLSIPLVFAQPQYTIDQSGTFSPIDISVGSTNLSIADDGTSPAQPIGFTFNFYGADYTNFYVAANGYLTFTNSSTAFFFGNTMPNTSVPNNHVAFAWTDLNPETGGIIRYQTVGTAPNRILVLEFSGINHYLNTDPVTVQTHLYEGSNRIEVHTTSKPNNPSLASPTCSQGVENPAGTEAVIVPGRMNSLWSATNDYVAFVPEVPPTAVCQDILVLLDASGSVTILPSQIDNGSFDPNGPVTLSLDIDTFDCSNIGPNTVTLTVTDSIGQTDTCTASVFILDNTPPVAQCQDLTIQLDASGSASITAADIDNGSTDACGIGSLSLSQTSFDCSNIGSNTVTLTVTDVNANVSTCTATVTVEDNIDPTITCPGDQFVTLDANCEALLPDLTGLATAADNCPGAVVTQDIPAGTVLSGAGSVQFVNLTVTDASGNTANCAVIVQAVDSTPPTITCPGDQFVTLDANCEASLPDLTGLATAADNCGTVTVTQDIPAGTVLSGAGSVQFVNLIATDGSGNTTSCGVIVQAVDSTPPTITCPGDQIRQLDANCEYAIEDFTGLATAADNCGTVTVTQDIPVGTVISGDGSVQLITLTATDSSGNSSTCQFIVQVEDDTPPTITCPADQFVLLDANCEAVVPDYTGLAVVADNCPTPISVTQDLPAGTPLAGTSALPITLTATDGAGNTATCTFTMNVVDETDPVIVCPANVTADNDPGECGAVVNFADAIAIDNCGIASVVQTAGPVSGSVFPIGTTVVEFTATDTSGNTAVCGFLVTVIDAELPVAVCQDITVELDENGEYVMDAIEVDNGSTDNCGIDSYELAGNTVGVEGLIAMYPWSSTGNLARYDYDPVSDAISLVDNPYGSTGVVTNYSLELNPVNNKVYLLADSPNTGNRALFEYDINAGAIVSELGDVISSTGANNANAMAIGNDGTVYVSFGNGNIQILDVNTMTSTSFSTFTAPGGGVGLTFDYDANRLIYTHNSGTVFMKEISTSGVMTPLNSFAVPGGCGTAQGLEYVGNGKVIAGTTFGCSEIYTVDLATGNAVSLLSNDGFQNNIKSLLYIGNAALIGEPSITFTCADVGENTVTLIVTDENGNVSTCEATVTVEDNIAPEIICVGAPGDVTYTQEFEGATVPTDWTTVIVSGAADWEFGSGDMVIGGDFPTNAAIFNDDAQGPDADNTVELYSPVFDLTGSTASTVSFDWALQDFAGFGNFTVDVWDGSAWQVILFATEDQDPINSGDIDVTAFQNADFQVRFTYDDDDDWGWGAGVDNFVLTYNMPATPYTVELDANGQAIVDANDLVMDVIEACGYTVTTAGVPPVPGSISTIFGSDNGGANGGAVYFDVTIGAEDISVTDIDINTDEAGAFTMDVYTVDGSYVGNEGNAAAWTLQAVASGTAAGTIDTPTNAVLDTPMVLSAGMSYGIALVLDAGHGHSYTNGDGTNENYSNADLSLTAGAASNVPFDGAPFSPRVFNGNVNYVIGTAPMAQIMFDCDDLGVSTVDIMVTDDSGNQAFCTASVEVVDLINPILVCQDATIVLDENGMSEVDPEIFLASSPSTYQVLVIGSDNDSGLEGFTDFTVDITDAAVVSFDWDYVSNDTAPGWDSFGYLLNGVYTQLTDPGLLNQSGSATVNVAPGDVFGFRSQTDDNILGNNETTISNFLPGFEGQFAQENWNLELNNSDGDAFFVEIPGGPLSYDNCGITVLAVDVTDVTCDDIGQTITVTVFASDASGNLASCTAELTVVDETGPVIENCPEDMTVDPGPLNLFYELPDYWATTDVTATDNCTDPVTILNQDPAPGTLLPDGVYTVTLSAEDEYGNVSECTFELTIESILGLDDQSFDTAVGLYPNPAENFVNIANGSGMELERVAIYDMNGRLVQDVALGNASIENTIDVSYLASGVYVVQIVGENDVQTVKRLVKE